MENSPYGSSGVMEGLIRLPLSTNSTNLVLCLRWESRGNQLLRYLLQAPQRWVTPVASWSEMQASYRQRMVLEVASGKQYFFMRMQSRVTTTPSSSYSGSIIFENNLQYQDSKQKQWVDGPIGHDLQKRTLYECRDDVRLGDTIGMITWGQFHWGFQQFYWRFWH